MPLSGLRSSTTLASRRSPPSPHLLLLIQGLPNAIVPLPPLAPPSPSSPPDLLDLGAEVVHLLGMSLASLRLWGRPPSPLVWPSLALAPPPPPLPTLLLSCEPPFLVGVARSLPLSLPCLLGSGDNILPQFIREGRPMILFVVLVEGGALPCLICCHCRRTRRMLF